MSYQMSRLLRIAALACAALALSASATQAASISLPVGGTQSFDIFWSKMVGSTELAALGQFDVTVAGGYADFSIDLTNNTSLASEKIHSIGFNADPNGTSIAVTESGKYFQNFDLEQKFPGFNTVDICVWGTQNCSGGGQGSNLPGAGTTDTFAFRLFGDFTNGLRLNNFVVKFQGQLGSFEFADTTPPRTVPEPSTLALLTIGAAAMTLSRRRKVQ
jgi:hypothetical protein